MLLVLALGFSLPRAGPAAEAPLSGGTARYFRELRRRGLYRLAESYCLERLSRKGLSLAERTELTLELSRALAEHATVAVEPEQTELWNRARAALAEFLKQEPKNPRRLLLDAQAAILPATIGHACRWQAELQPFDAAAKQRAVQALNEAIDGLRTVEGAVADGLRKSPAARGAAEGELHGFELRALAAHVRYRLGSAMIDLAHLHPADSPDRAAVLLDAQKVLRSVPGAGDDPDLVWMSRVAAVECSRLLGDPARTLKELDLLDRQSPPPEFADRLLAERVRTLMMQKKFREAAALLDDAEASRTPLPGELALLQIQLPLAQWQGEKPAVGAPLPQKLAEALEERAARLRRDVGGYWSYRGDLLLRQVRDIGEYGAELAALAGMAQAAFNAGRSEEAIELYGQAAARAHRDGRPEQAFHFGFTRASIEINAKSWAHAAADLLELAEQFPENPKAPDAHLLAAYALGKAYDEKPTPGRREEYTRVLEEHRARYGKSPTVSEATWMLAKLRDRRGKLSAALELYKSIPPASKHAPAARVAVARTYEKILDRLRELHEPLDQWEEEAIQTLDQWLPALAERNGAAEAEVPIRLARILLRASPPQFEAADRLLVRAAGMIESPGAAQSDTLPPGTASPRLELRALVRQLQVVSLAGQGKFQEAREMLQTLSTTSPPELLRILDGLAPLQADDRQDPFHDLGELQLEAALKLSEQRAALSAAEQRRLDECLARAYIATRQPERGIEIYARLLERAPHDKALLTAYAELLMKCAGKECLKKALAAWHKLEAMHKSATPEWFAMRYEVCRTLVLLEDKTEAGKLLKMTRLLYPKIRDDKLQQKFAELEALCAGENGNKPKKANGQQGAPN
ncbi:MAG: hypothetical protein ACM3U2_17290 [Deltaproteobacteria bacterium]